MKIYQINIGIYFYPLNKYIKKYMKVFKNYWMIIVIIMTKIKN